MHSSYSRHVFDPLHRTFLAQGCSAKCVLVQSIQPDTCTLQALRFMFTAEELKYLDSYPDADEEDVTWMVIRAFVDVRVSFFVPPTAAFCPMS